jgi:hypothetical protein
MIENMGSMSVYKRRGFTYNISERFIAHHMVALNWELLHA